VEELFRNKEHLVTYKDEKDVMEKIEELVVDREERESIALRGFNEVYSKHTIYHRVEEILKVCGIHETI
jgi:spore maturation protein CgeB